MARIRTVKPEFWTDEKLTEVSMPARLLFVGLLNFADDFGNLERSAKRIKMQIFPADDIDCESLLQELLGIGVLVDYIAAGQTYLHIKNFRKHQQIQHASKPKHPLPALPALSGLPDDALTTCDELSEGSIKEVDMEREKEKEKNEAADEPTNKPASSPRKRKTALPEGFAVSDRVARWATEKGHGRLDEHLENFISAARRKGYAYADWDEAFMEAVRKNWAGLAADAAGVPIWER